MPSSTRLRSGADPGELTAEAARALDGLLAAGLVFRAAPGSGAELAVAQAQFGADGLRRLADRAGHRIGVRAEGPSRAIVAELLALTGLEVDDHAVGVAGGRVRADHPGDASTRWSAPVRRTCW